MTAKNHSIRLAANNTAHDYGESMGLYISDELNRLPSVVRHYERSVTIGCRKGIARTRLHGVAKDVQGRVPAQQIRRLRQALVLEWAQEHRAELLEAKSIWRPMLCMSQSTGLGCGCWA